MEHAQIPYIIDRLWDERYLTQVTELYIVATLLRPINFIKQQVGVTPATAFGDIMTRFFQHYTTGKETEYMRDFWAFRDQRDGFFSHESSI